MKTIIRTLLASALMLAFFTLNAQRDQDVQLTNKDVVHLDDVIIQGSECVGLDCSNGESFGFDTERLKENNLRIHFDDTSTSASFPSNDWRIVINDSNNGGGNYFAIQDATANKTPFRIEANARNHALYVDDGGRVGLGTNAPVVELHVVDGDTPTMRLEQNGSSGFTAQTWDLAGNETNFFVRDVTNGSKLPFKIRPGASTNALVLDTDGDVGIGTLTSDTKLDVRGDVQIKTTANTTATTAFEILNSDSDVGMSVDDGGRVGIGTDNINARLQLRGDSEIDFAINSASGNPDMSFVEAGNMRAQIKYHITDNGLGFFVNDSGSGYVGIADPALFADGTNNRIGIGTETPGTLLEVNGSASKPGGGSWAVASDRRLKKNINTYEEGLKEVLAFEPVTFQYNGKGGIDDTNTTFVGLIAQEAKEVASHMVTNVERVTSYSDNGSTNKVKEDYLMLDPSAIPYMLINSIKEQQAQLDAKDAEIQDLKEQVNKLEGVFNTLLEKLDGVSFEGEINHEEDVVLGLDELPFLKQNVPNPYNAETVIEYFVPETAQSSELFFYDNQGKLLKKHVLGAKGFGRINLKAADLPSGTYVYSLVIDGKMISSKKMSIQ